MIDYVSMYKQIPIPRRSFRSDLWHDAKTDSGEPCCWFKSNGVTLYYYFLSEKLTIRGKLIALLHNTQVQNFDDIYGGLREQFVDELNERINRLFTRPLVDIREFRVARIDYCVNVETPYVGEYITFLKRAFQRVNNGKRVDHTARFDLEGSVYIKNAAEYEENIRKNYTLNVYDKQDRLEFQEEHGVHVEGLDFLLAENILRIEVQASYQFIQSLCKHFGVERDFVSLFDYEIALFAISAAFKRVFRLNAECDFYTYKAAKAIVPRGKTQQTLYSAATNHNVTGAKYEYGCKQAVKSGIYPYCLLPVGFETQILKNPIKLVYEKIKYFL